MSVPALRFKEFSSEWVENKLESITKDKISYGIVQAGPHIDDGVPYIKSSNVGGAIDLNQLQRTSNAIHYKYRRSAVHPNDIVFSLRGNIGQVSIVPTEIVEANLTQGTARISVDDLNYNKFVYFQMQTERFLEGVTVRSKGSTFQEISLGDLRMVPIMQSSLPEQIKIANFLTAVDQKISLLTQKADLLSQYKKGVMQQIFSQELRFKDDDGQEFPEWEEKTLGEIAKFRRGSFPQPYGLAKWYDDINGMPFIQVFDVDDNFKLKNKTKRRISKEAQQQSVFVKTGSILITIQGSIGRIAVTQYDAFVDRTLLLFESFKVDINKHYFAYILFLLFEIEKEKAPGGIIKTITKEVLTGFNVFICDYKEQTKIANFLTAIDDKITNNQIQLNAVKQYKQGLLQQMFV